MIAEGTGEFARRAFRGLCSNKFVLSAVGARQVGGGWLDLEGTDANSFSVLDNIIFDEIRNVQIPIVPKGEIVCTHR